MSTTGRVLLALAVLSVSAPRVMLAEPPPLPEERITQVVQCPMRGEGAAFSISADSRRLLVSDNHSCQLWDIETATMIASFGAPTPDPADGYTWAKHNRTWSGRPQGVLSPDGRLVAVCYGLQNDVYLYDAATRNLLRRLDHGEQQVRGLAFSADGKTLASSTEEVARLWNVAEGEEELRLKILGPNERNSFGMVALSPDGKTVAVSLSDCSVAVCNAQNGELIHRLVGAGLEQGQVSLAYSPDGELLAIVYSREGAVRVWDAVAGTLVRTASYGPGTGVAGVPSFSPDGKTLAVECCGIVRLLELATGHERRSLSPAFLWLAFTRADRLSVAGGVGARVGVFAIDLWGSDANAPGHPRPNRPASLSPEQVGQLWDDLAAADSAVAYRALVALCSSPHGVAEELSRRLAPERPGTDAAASKTGAELDKLIADLQDDDFDVREQAFRSLAAIGPATRSRLVRAMADKPPAELAVRARRLLALLDAPPGPEQLRRHRAIEVLEYIGSADAKEGLRKLASGPEGAPAAEDARAALKRLENK